MSGNGNGWRRFWFGLAFLVIVGAGGVLWTRIGKVAARADEGRDRAAIARADVEALRRETAVQFDAIQRETKARFEAVLREIKHLREDNSKAAEAAGEDRARLRALIEARGK